MNKVKLGKVDSQDTEIIGFHNGCEKMKKEVANTIQNGLNGFWAEELLDAQEIRIIKEYNKWLIERIGKL